MESRPPPEAASLRERIVATAARYPAEHLPLHLGTYSGIRPFSLIEFVALAGAHFMITLVKFVHITAVAIWVGGLISLPAFYRQLGHMRAVCPKGSPQIRVHDAMRFTYVSVASPAAFVAVGSGTLLIFQSAVVSPWFALKLTLVVCLVIAHSFAGLTVSRLSDESEGYPAWRYFGATGLSFVLAVAIVALTLSKPSLTGALLPASLSEPGALKILIESVNPWHRP